MQQQATTHILTLRLDAAIRSDKPLGTKTSAILTHTMRRAVVGAGDIKDGFFTVGAREARVADALAKHTHSAIIALVFANTFGLAVVACVPWKAKTVIVLANSIRTTTRAAVAVQRAIDSRSTRLAKTALAGLKAHTAGVARALG